ncbi:hypothetical protein [Burkholderia ubonensis]|uniref:hypothetical protein n=1 Tax=Burkholderia ubonensis TaxID=101571 RepID=UPI00075B5F4D|nr:hypothetical protein [Burkholderia ubonensis]KVO11743.1 hypothetical protein WJ73_19540 [Burkholderia ubonensis]
MATRKELTEQAQTLLYEVSRARDIYEKFDEERWAAARNPFEAWADYSSRTPARNKIRAALKDAQQNLQRLTSRKRMTSAQESLEPA